MSAIQQNGLRRHGNGKGFLTIEDDLKGESSFERDYHVKSTSYKALPRSYNGGHSRIQGLLCVESEE